MNYLNDKVYKKLLVVLLIAIAFYYLLFYIDEVSKIFSRLLNIISPFLIGGAMAFILKIPMNFFERNIFKGMDNTAFQSFKRPLAIVLSLLIAVMIVGFLGALVIPQIIESFISLQQQLPIFVEELIGLLNRVSFLEKYAQDLEMFYNSFSWSAFFQKIGAFIFTENINILSTGFNFTTYLASGITNFFLSLFFSIYILLDKEKLKRQSQKLLQAFFRKKSNYIIYVASIIHDYFYAFINGQLLDAVIIGAMAFVGMMIMGIPYKGMISALVAFFDLIPILGPIIGTAIGIVFIIIESPTKALIFLIMMLIFQQIQGNFIYPKIMGNSLNLPSMWTLFGTIVGGSLMGIMGMWLFIPLFAVIYRLISEYTNNKLKRQSEISS
ncbi:MAG: AI-2E family transporter [Peptoniphilus sp.]|nr:AI-2E family transporter [Peptoniphilus sp.]